MRMTFQNKLVTGVVGLAVAVAPFAMGADKKAESSKPAAAKKATAAKPGMMVVKDPVTGELRAPTAAEYQALNGGGGASAGRSTGLQTSAKGGSAEGRAAATPVQRPDGTLTMALDDSTAVFAVATRTPEGKVVMGEVTGAKAANAVVSNAGKKAAAATTPAKGATNNEK